MPHAWAQISDGAAFKNDRRPCTAQKWARHAGQVAFRRRARTLTGILHWGHTTASGCSRACVISATSSISASVSSDAKSTCRRFCAHSCPGHVKSIRCSRSSCTRNCPKHSWQDTCPWRHRHTLMLSGGASGCGKTKSPRQTQHCAVAGGRRASNLCTKGLYETSQSDLTHLRLIAWTASVGTSSMPSYGVLLKYF